MDTILRGEKPWGFFADCLVLVVESKTKAGVCFHDVTFSVMFSAENVEAITKMCRKCWSNHKKIKRKCWRLKENVGAITKRLNVRIIYIYIYIYIMKY